jgi:hypothetical protein
MDRCYKEDCVKRLNELATRATRGVKVISLQKLTKSYHETFILTFSQLPWNIGFWFLKNFRGPHFIFIFFFIFFTIILCINLNLDGAYRI